MSEPSPHLRNRQPEPSNQDEAFSACPISGGQETSRQKWILLGIIVLLAFAVRMAHYTCAIASPLLSHPLSLSDSIYYDNRAHRIAAGHLLGDEVFFMAPAYEYALGFCYHFISDRLPTVLFLQCLGGALASGLIYWIAQALFGVGAGLISGALAALYSVFIYYDCMLLPYGPTMYIHVACLFVLLYVGQRGSLWAWLGVGAALGITAIAHGSALTILPGIVAWIWLRGQNESRRSKLVATTATILAFTAVVSVVTIRNYVAGRDFVLLTSNAGMILNIGNNPNATGTYMQMDYPYKGMILKDYQQGWVRGPDDPMPSELSRIARDQALSFMWHHPGRTAKLLVKKFSMLFSDTELFINDHLYFFERFSPVLRLPIPSFGLVATLGVTGAICCLPRWRELFPLYVFSGMQVFVYTLTSVQCRYKLVLGACLMIFAGVAVVRWIDWLRRRAIRRLGLSTLLMVGTAWFVFRPMAGFSKTDGFGQKYNDVGIKYLRQRPPQPKKALNEFSKAVEASFAPYAGEEERWRLGSAYWGLGASEFLLGRREKAIEHYQMALDYFAGLSIPEARRDLGQAMEELEKLRQRM